MGAITCSQACTIQHNAPESLRKLIQHLLASMGAPSSHGEIGDRQQREGTPEEGKGSKEGEGEAFSSLKVRDKTKRHN